MARIIFWWHRNFEMTHQGPCHSLMAGLGSQQGQPRSEVSLWLLLRSPSTYQFLCFVGTQVLLHVAESPILWELASFLLIVIGDLREKMTFPLKRDLTLGILSGIFDVVFTLVDNDNIIKSLWTSSEMICVNCLGKYRPLWRPAPTHEVFCKPVIVPGLLLVWNFPFFASGSFAPTVCSLFFHLKKNLSLAHCIRSLSAAWTTFVFQSRVLES